MALSSKGGLFQLGPGIEDDKLYTLMDMEMDAEGFGGWKLRQVVRSLVLSPVIDRYPEK